MPARKPTPKPAAKPLSRGTVRRLVHIVGSKHVGYGIEVHGLLGTDEIQTPNLALAIHLRDAIRDFVRAMPAARQHRAFDQHDTRLAMLGRQP